MSSPRLPLSSGDLSSIQVFAGLATGMGELNHNLIRDCVNCSSIHGDQGDISAIHGVNRCMLAVTPDVLSGVGSIDTRRLRVGGLKIAKNEGRCHAGGVGRGMTAYDP